MNINSKGTMIFSIYLALNYVTYTYCLSSAMHGQNINLPVCVCVCLRVYMYMYVYVCVCVSVCVSVTLSVNSPIGQTPQRIFTFDSLTDADFHKDVPFGGLDDE